MKKYTLAYFEFKGKLQRYIDNKHAEKPDPLGRYEELRPFKKRMKLGKGRLKDLGVDPLYCTGCRSNYYPEDGCTCSVFRFDNANN